MEELKTGNVVLYNKTAYVVLSYNKVFFLISCFETGNDKMVKTSNPQRDGVEFLAETIDEFIENGLKGSFYDNALLSREFFQRHNESLKREKENDEKQNKLLSKLEKSAQEMINDKW